MTTATRARIDPRLFTVAEYQAMAEAGILQKDERIELLEGKVFLMAAIGNPHLFCTDALNMLFVPPLVGRAIVRVQGSIQLDDHSAPQPDVALLRPRGNYHGESAMPADVLLVIEVADSSLDLDLGYKAALYAAAGIPELWVVNLRAGEVTAHTDPQGAAYATVRAIARDGSVSPQAFPDLTLQLADFVPLAQR